MGEYRHSAHATFDLKYHVIWITKYRYKILRGRIAERARDLIREVCQARDVVIMRGAISPDHIHMLLSARRIWHRQAGAVHQRPIVSKTARGVPGATKTVLGQHLWARGYFCATVGAVDEQTIKAYIENQKWDEDEQDSRSPRPPSLEAALSRRCFRRLQPQADFQSE